MTSASTLANITMEHTLLKPMILFFLGQSSKYILWFKNCRLIKLTPK